MAHSTFASLSDDELLVSVARLTARSNASLAELLSHLGEVERRGIHRNRACASLYTYCVYELRMSEDAAYRRSKAARLVREYPELRELVARGEIHLTGLLMIGPHLGGEAHAEILVRSRFRSKREISRLLAEIDPRATVPASVEPLGPAPARVATHATFVESMAGPVRELPPGRCPSDWMNAREEALTDGMDASEVDPPVAPTPAPARDAALERPVRPLHYKVQFTASQEYVDLLDEALALLGHESPRPHLPEVQLLALRMLVERLRAQKRAATDRPRKPAKASASSSSAGPVPERKTFHRPVPARVGDSPDEARTIAASAPPPAHGRHIPAPARRVVWARDGARCAYVDGRGQRCRETSGLELHHRHAHALGGPPTVANLELRCKAHNTLAAEADFGREYVDWVRGGEGNVRRQATWLLEKSSRPPMRRRGELGTGIAVQCSPWALLEFSPCS